MDPVILDQLQAEEAMLKELYESVKATVWAVKIKGSPKKGEVDEVNLTAFAVHKDEVKNKVYLMSCAHGDWRRWYPLEIYARPLNGTADAEYKGQAVEIRSKSDTSLFEVPLDGVVGGVVVGKFGTGDLHVGEMIMAVGNYACCKGTCMIGRVIYPCISNPVFVYDDRHRCANHNAKYALDTKQPCRIAGHIFNIDYFKGIFKDTEKSDIDCVKHLQANIPIVHCAGLVGGGGCSGSPMVNMKGEMVGMFICGADDYQAGVHVAFLKAFLEDSLKLKDDPGMGSSGKGETITKRLKKE